MTTARLTTLINVIEAIEANTSMSPAEKDLRIKLQAQNHLTAHALGLFDKPQFAPLQATKPEVRK
jgi:hypothetical protein